MKKKKFFGKIQITSSGNKKLSSRLFNNFIRLRPPKDGITTEIFIYNM